MKYLIFAILIIITSGLIGLALNLSGSNIHPVVYWLIGGIGGLISGILIAVSFNDVTKL